MQLGPVPGTALYESYREQGKLLPDVPHRAKHGQRAIWFHHEHFTPDESREILRQAFVHDYREQGPSLLRAMQTTLQGYEYCRAHPDPAIRVRAAAYRPMLRLMRYFVTGMRFHCRAGAGRELLQEVRAAFDRLLGRQGLKTRLFSLVVLLFSIKERLRIAWFSDVRQPRTLYCLPKPGLRIVGAGR
jgi:hypothetical protein